MITGFNHTSFTVGDLDRAVRFWTEALGFRAASVSERSGDWQGRVTGVPGATLRVAHLHGHGHHMEFIQYLSGVDEARRIEPNMAGAAHVCLEVTDIEATARALLAAGAAMQGEVADVTSGVAAGGRAGYLRDPNGIIIELYEPPAALPSAGGLQDGKPRI
jgi:catechol 2,3-dioxygenase-like lactoylglutathione lyase family enzyme